MSDWQRWFAWYPVEVEAYEVDEISRGRLRYHVWLRWVEYRREDHIYDDEEGVMWVGEAGPMKYRLPRSMSSTPGTETKP